jgi:hypothetical protein
MRLILAATAALLVSTAAYAADDIMAATYGNTVVGKSAMFESHTHYNADHSFSAAYSSAMGSMEAKGTWAVNDKGELCRTFANPPPGSPNPLCVAWTSHKVGDTWTMSTANGGSVAVSLVAGVQ